MLAGDKRFEQLEEKPLTTTDKEFLYQLATKMSGESRTRLMCLSKKEPPPKWTHFEVTGLSKGKTMCFVKPVAGPANELVAQYSPPNSEFRNSKQQEAV